MSKNCLVTKLKGVVDNDNLDVFGQVKLHLSPKAGAQNPWVKFSFTKFHRLTCTDTLTLNGNAQYEVAANNLVTCTVSGSGYLVIDDKYSLSYFESSGVDVVFDIAKLTYTEITKCSINSSPVTGDFVAFLNNNQSLTEVDMWSNQITGDLSEVKPSVLNGLTILKLGSDKIYGTCGMFNASSLLFLGVNNCKNFTGTVESLPNKQNIVRLEIYNSGVTGSIDAYVASAISSGLTSKTNLDFVGALTQLTFNGAKQDVSGISNVGSCFVSWDANGKISVATGAYSTASVTHVFCKGYTQQEAEAAFPGKTIIRVDA